MITEKYPKLALHFTEGGPRLNDHYDTDFCKWTIMASRALSCGYKSFVGWNLILDEMGGPNVGPFFCGGLVTINSESAELSYSGQYKAFRHLSPYIGRDSLIYSLKTNETDAMTSYPNEMRRSVYGLMIDNKDGRIVLVLANGNSYKRQVQIFLKGKWWYAELLPDTVSTLII